MEAIIFCATMGLFEALVFVLIGVGISEANFYLNKKRGKGNARNVRQDADSDCVLDSGVDSVSVSDIRSTDGKERDRRDLGCYDRGKITRECAENALREIRRSMRTMLSQTELDALDYTADLLKESEINLLEIQHRFGDYVRYVVEDMLNGRNERYGYDNEKGK